MDIKEKKLHTLMKWFQDDFVNVLDIEGLQQMINQTIKQIQKKVLNNEEDDLLSVLNLVIEKFSENREGSRFYLELYIILKAFAALVDQNGYFAKKNFLEVSIKLHISSILDQLLKSNIESIKTQLIILLFLNCAFPLWRKTGDHVPELYRTFKNIFQFFAEQFETSPPDQKTLKFKEEDNPQLFKDLITKTLLVEDSEIKIIDKNNYSKTLSLFLSFFKNSIKLTNTDPNFEIIHQSILQNLNDISRHYPSNSNLNQRISQLSGQLVGWFQDYQQKVSLDIILEKPLIQIKQLTPKMQDNHELTQVQQRQILKKKIMKTQKSLIKEIKQDHLVLHKNKLEGEENQRVKNKASYKKFLSLMDDQHKQIQRMQSTQLNIQRNKKHSTRKAGNQME